MGGITGKYIFVRVSECVSGTKSCARLAFILRFTARAYSLRLGLAVTSGSDSPRGP